MAKGEKTGWNFNFTTRDIVIIAVIAAITGVVNTGVGNLWYLLNTSLGPLGGALLQGAFMWAYILAMWLISKTWHRINCRNYRSCRRNIIRQRSRYWNIRLGFVSGFGY